MMQDRYESMEASLDETFSRFETVQERRGASCDGVKHTLEAITTRVVEVATGLEILVGCIVGIEERLQKVTLSSGTVSDSSPTRRQQQQKQQQQLQPKQQRRQLRQWLAPENKSPEACSPATSPREPSSPASRQSRAAKRRLGLPSSIWTPRTPFLSEDKPGKRLDDCSSCDSTRSSARSDLFSKDLLASITSIATAGFREDLPASFASAVDARLQRCEERILAKLGHASTVDKVEKQPSTDESTKQLNDSQAEVGGSSPCDSTESPERSRKEMCERDAGKGRPSSRSSSRSSTVSQRTLPPAQSTQLHVASPEKVNVQNGASSQKPMGCGQQAVERFPFSARCQSECMLPTNGGSIASFTPQDGKNITAPVLRSRSMNRVPSIGDRTTMESRVAPGLQRPGLCVRTQESPQTCVQSVPNTPLARFRTGVVAVPPWAATSESPQTWGSVALMRHASAAHLAPHSPPWQTPELLTRTIPQFQPTPPVPMHATSMPDHFLRREATQ